MFSHYQDRIYDLACAILRDEPAAEDAGQEKNPPLAKHLNEPDYPYGNKWFIDKLPPDDNLAVGNRGLSSAEGNLLTLAQAG